MRNSRGLRLGTIGGVPLFLTPGWALVAVILILLFGPTVQRALGIGLLPAAVLAAAIPVLLALSVLLHELAHGLMAQRFRVQVREYVLSLWGGHTAFGSEIDRPGASALISLAGPLTNLVLAGIFWYFAQDSDGPALALILFAVAITNGFVAVFNLLPALPMDGGRLLEALVWRVSGDRDLGTLIAGRCGQVIAVVVALGSIGYSAQTLAWMTGIWGVLIGLTLWRGATVAVRAAHARRAVRDVDLGAWAIPVTVLAYDASVAALHRQATPGSLVLLSGQDNVPSAWVQPKAVAAVPAAEQHQTPLSAVAVPLPEQALLNQHTGAGAVAQLAQAARAGARYAVLVGLDRQALAVVDIVDAGRRLPR
ncbi:MAG: site-2 protease family protein [Beutenbergiaceae bacterium]